MIEWLLSGGWILVCCVCGPVMVLQHPMPKVSQQKNRKAKRAKQKGEAREKYPKPPKRKKQKQEKRKPIAYPPESLARIERYYRERDGVAQDGWQAVGGLPL